MNSTVRTVDELWLRTLERVAARAAHEIKGALNGVAVNLEVVRARAAKPEAPAAAVATFAGVAAGQLEAVVEMSEAMLQLARAPREPVDVAIAVRGVAALLRSAARGEGHALEVVESGDGVPPSADAGWPQGNSVRLAVASAMRAGMDCRCDMRCRVVRQDGEVTLLDVECTGPEAGAPTLEPDITNAVSEAGIAVRTTARGISLAFPQGGEPLRERA